MPVVCFPPGNYSTRKLSLSLSGKEEVLRGRGRGKEIVRVCLCKQLFRSICAAAAAAAAAAVSAAAAAARRQWQ